MKAKRYRHQPIRRVHIPKEGGKTRPIGVSAFEDKIVQDVNARPVQNKLLHRGRPLTRGTEVAAHGGEEVGGLHTSVDVGELAGNSDPAEQRRPVLM